MKLKGNFLSKIIYVLVVCICAISTLVAQTEKIAFEKYGVAEGLPEEYVSSMVQDDQGFMWFTTQNGLVKFDGYTMKVYKGEPYAPGSEKLAFRNLNGGMLKSKTGHLWIASVLGVGGIASFDPETEAFRNYISNPKDSTCIPFQNSRLLFEDYNGHIWFTNYSSDPDTVVIARLNPKTHITKTYPYETRLNYNDFIFNRKMLPSKADSAVWLISETNSLLVLNRETDAFEEVIPTGSEIPGSGIKDTLYSITRGNKDHLLITGGYNLFIWDPVKKQSIKTYSNLAGNDGNQARNGIYYAFEDINGQYWVFSYPNHEMITIIDSNTNTLTKLIYGEGPLKFKNAPKTGFEIFPYLQNHKGIWFQISSKLGSTFMYHDFSTKSFKYYNGQFNDDLNPLSERISSSYNYKMLEDRTGLLWLGTRPNFYKQSPKTRQIDLYRHQPDDNNSLTSDTIIQIYEDSKQRLWISTQSELSLKLEDDRFKSFSYKNTKGEEQPLGKIRKIYEDSKGTIWVVSRKHGLLRLNESKQEFQYFFFSKEDGYIPDIQADAKGNLWISIYNKGVYILDSNIGKLIKKFETDTKDTHGLLTNRVSRLFLDSKGNMWLGDSGDNELGLFKYIEKDNTFKHYHRDDSDALTVNSNEIGRIIEDDRNRIWVGTDGGVNLYDQEKDVFHPSKTSFDISSAQTLVKGVNGKVWVATYASGGLALVGPGIDNVEMFGEDKGLLHNDARNLVFDDLGNLWLPTQRGLSVLDTLTKTFISYFEKDGFQKYGRSNTILKTKNGDIWIGGRNGLNHIVPSQLAKKDSMAPCVLITSLSINDSFYSTPDGAIFTKSVSYTDAISLSYDQKDLGFEFVALHYLRPEDNQYSWKLEHYDKNWTTPSMSRHAAYTNLSPGTYTFRVKASNADGVWNDEGASIQITINPPWWLTWWAYIVYAIFAALIGFRIHKFQKERAQRQAREKAREKELEQAKEIEKAYTELKSTQAQLVQSEKMASLGELTAGIAHEIQNPLNFVNNFSEVSNELVDEMKDEFKKGDTEEGFAIADDIKQNLEKIAHHGKRADAIVKGMLAHSRAGKGEKAPTDLNALTDEYLRLSYHGLRAKDKSFNADFKTDFDPNLPMVNVVTQDIGRVILNLINNAFQACASEGIKNPTVTVSTSRVGTPSGKEGSAEGIQITVSDNGPGIPDSIKDKIFQPFFTTKPTGQGTGLGLSLSYDIVKAHGGALTVETAIDEGNPNQIGKGTTFTILLPTN